MKYLPIGHSGCSVQEVLAEPEWSGRMTDEDRRALSPLFWAHVNPYGRFVLDMDTCLDLATDTNPGASPELLSNQSPESFSDAVSSDPI